MTIFYYGFPLYLDWYFDPCNKDEPASADFIGGVHLRIRILRDECTGKVICAEGRKFKDSG